ncbi:MAG: hypothetical protein H6733_17840 [Alphaproteobacteria bacterium]|nr:hypothetical protein [Alphaproteobacteria bacterium]
MTAAIYSLSAALAAALATRAWLLDRDAPARRAFLGLGWSVALAHLSFALSFLPGLAWLRGVWTLAGTVAPAALWHCLDVYFHRNGGPSSAGQRLVAASWTVGVVATIAHAVWWGSGLPRSSPPEVVAGTWAFGVLVACVALLVQLARHTSLPTVRTRMRWLATVIGTGTGLALLEWVVRTTQPVIDPATLPFFDRGLALHGAMPPLSALFAAFTAYMLYHALLAHRLAALRELAARMATVSAAAALLVLAHTLTLVWVALTRFPLHSSFLLFLVSAVFLSVYSSSRTRLEQVWGRVLNPPGEALAAALDDLADELPRRIDAGTLAQTVAHGLHTSGRFEHVSVWLVEPGRSTFVCSALAGPSPHIRAADPPPELPSDAVARWLEPGGVVGARLAWFEAQGAELVLPLRRSDTWLGWISLAAAAGTDGVSPDERRHLADLADRVALALGQIERFRTVAEERRLAALGAMSAGLAHEVRNPLAGLKGAAQILESEQLSGDAAEMLGIIVHESDRLDRVVSDFLVVARPGQAPTTPVHLEQVATHAASVVRAAGLPREVTVTVQAADDTPVVLGDANRLEQVLLNLVRNAVDAVGARGRVVVATGSGRALDGRLTARVVVSDDGPGMPAEVVDQLFTPFFTTKAAGTGLGLAICRSIVDAHRGQLSVRSTPGEGTAFTVALPAADQPASPRLSSAPPGSAPAPGTKREPS